jgi:hypothetical protein
MLAPLGQEGWVAGHGEAGVGGRPASPQEEVEVGGRGVDGDRGRPVGRWLGAAVVQVKLAGSRMIVHWAGWSVATRRSCSPLPRSGRDLGRFSRNSPTPSTATAGSIRVSTPRASSASARQVDLLAAVPGGGELGHHGGRPTVDVADVLDQVVHPPAPAGGDRSGRVGSADGAGEPGDLGIGEVAEPLVRVEASHAASLAQRTDSCSGGSGNQIERLDGGGSSAQPLVRYALTPRSRGPGAPMAGARDHLLPRPAVGPARLEGGAGERLQAVVCVGTPWMSGGFPRTSAGHLRRSQDGLDVYTN